jgi:hypothetical protein
MIIPKLLPALAKVMALVIASGVWLVAFALVFLCAAFMDWWLEHDHEQELWRETLRKEARHEYEIRAS